MSTGPGAGAGAAAAGFLGFFCASATGPAKQMAAATAIVETPRTPLSNLRIVVLLIHRFELCGHRRPIPRFHRIRSDESQRAGRHAAHAGHHGHSHRSLARSPKPTIRGPAFGSRANGTQRADGPCPTRGPRSPRASKKLNDVHAIVPPSAEM